MRFGCNLNLAARNPGQAEGADGYEDTFTGNCLGHFLLTNRVLDLCRGGWTDYMDSERDA